MNWFTGPLKARQHLASTYSEVSDGSFPFSLGLTRINKQSEEKGDIADCRLHLRS